MAFGSLHGLDLFVVVLRVSPLGARRSGDGVGGCLLLRSRLTS